MEVIKNVICMYSLTSGILTLVINESNELEVQVFVATEEQGNTLSFVLTNRISKRLSLYNLKAIQVVLDYYKTAYLDEYSDDRLCTKTVRMEFEYSITNPTGIKEEYEETLKWYNILNNDSTYL